MADLYGDNVTSKTKAVPQGFADATNARGRNLSLIDQKTLAAAAIADRIFLGSVPSVSVIKKDSKIYNAALGAGVTLSIGDKNDDNALVAGQAVAVAGSFDLVTTANVGKKAWEMLNYAEDPGDNLELFATIAGGAATGVLAWEIDFTQ